MRASGVKLCSPLSLRSQTTDVNVRRDTAVCMRVTAKINDETHKRLLAPYPLLTSRLKAIRDLSSWSQQSCASVADFEKSFAKVRLKYPSGTRALVSGNTKHVESPYKYRAWGRFCFRLSRRARSRASLTTFHSRPARKSKSGEVASPPRDRLLPFVVSGAWKMRTRGVPTGRRRATRRHATSARGGSCSTRTRAP